MSNEITITLSPDEMELLHRLAHSEALSRVSAGDRHEAAAALQAWLHLDEVLDRWEREEEEKN